MRLDSARGLKELLTKTVLAPQTALVFSFKSADLPAGSISAVQPSIAIGIGTQGPGNFVIAVRCQRLELMTGKEIVQIRKKARGEVDVRFVGPITKRTTPWTRQRHRPVPMGASLGHFDVTAGTLACFVRNADENAPLILSNNHVLANENKSKIGDAILQPGAADGGKAPAEKVAELAGMVRLKKAGKNQVDGAVAKLLKGIQYDPRTIRGLGKLAGLGPEFLDEGTEVAKLGRTTGLTHGLVTAFEMDHVVVNFGLGLLRFDNQIEIEGKDGAAFSRGGDSGALIVDANTRLAIALLFAGTDIGGFNGQGLTYANPIRAVLKALKVGLLVE
jgi:hypothetical protein